MRLWRPEPGLLPAPADSGRLPAWWLNSFQAKIWGSTWPLFFFLLSLGLYFNSQSLCKSQWLSTLAPAQKGARAPGLALRSHGPWHDAAPLFQASGLGGVRSHQSGARWVSGVAEAPRPPGRPSARWGQPRGPNTVHF